MRDKTCLYCLTADGVIALATRYNRSRRALLARLLSLDRALDAQNAFVPRVHSLASISEVLLHNYRLGALRWDSGGQRGTLAGLTDHAA